MNLIPARIHWLEIIGVTPGTALRLGEGQVMLRWYPAYGYVRLVNMPLCTGKLTVTRGGTVPVPAVEGNREMVGTDLYQSPTGEGS